MLVKLVGYAPVDFTNDAGVRIVGNNLYVNFPDPDVTGLFAGKIFVRPDITLPQGSKSGDELEMQFTPKGKLVSISKA